MAMTQRTRRLTGFRRNAARHDVKPAAGYRGVESAGAKPARPYWRDRFFWLAVVAAPVFWLGLAAYTSTPAAGLGPFREPQRFLWLALVYPVLEELAFRGGLQPALGDLLQGVRWPADPLTLPNLLTSLLFSALHLLSHSPAWAVAVIVPSLVFGYFRERHRGVASPIVLHCLYNGGYYVWFGA